MISREWNKKCIIVIIFFSAYAASVEGKAMQNFSNSQLDEIMLVQWF